jgi:F420-non-reducing hydrogenase large subunit
MSRRITIDPITRLEGHGRIEVFLDDNEEVENVYLQIPELRGFEAFCEGRPVEEMPRITTRICGVCPEAHHMASAKAADAVYGIEIPSAAKKLRELLYSAFYVTDHTTHFYILGGPDFIMGPDADVGARNILGVIGKVGIEVAGKVLECRKRMEEIIQYLGGKQVHPVCAIPGGMSKPLSEEQRVAFLKHADWAIEFSKFTLQIFKDIVLANKNYMDLILSQGYQAKIHNMGLVDANNHVNFYDGDIRVTGPDGTETVRFAPNEYKDQIAEHVESWSYLKFPYIKKVGWKGIVEGQDSGIYRASPLSRLNAADGMATPLAQAAYEEFYATVGGKPCNATLGTHWARVIEIVYAAERLKELLEDDEITSPKVHAIPTQTPSEGVGVVEAPRGTLYHHYVTDENGIIKRANLIVGTTNNNASISLSLKTAAQQVIKKGTEITEPILNMIEMAFRAYDPCFGCATHAINQRQPLILNFYNPAGELLKTIRRD